MMKQGILHPQLARVLAELQHTDTIVIGDAGLPVPKDVERIDLGWRPGSPALLEVLEEILKVIVVEKATFANQTRERSGALYADAVKMLEGVPVEHVEHVRFKELNKGAKAVILTGEFTPYANVMLTAGCAF